MRAVEAMPCSVLRSVLRALRSVPRHSESWLAVLVIVLVAGCITTDDDETRRPLDLGDLGYETPAPRDERPIRLVGRDGTDLPLVGLSLSAIVEDPLALTEMRLDFENGEPGPVDAELLVTLPADARVTRFAAFIEGSWREAEVVERTRGTVLPSLFTPPEAVFSPAPREGTQAFRVVLPRIPGGSVQQLILTYAETFEDVDETYRVYLEGIHDVRRASVKAVVHGQPNPLVDVFAGSRVPEVLGYDESGHRHLSRTHLDWTPTGDLVVPNSGKRRVGVRSGRKVAVRVNPLSHDHQAAFNGLTVLFDTSASQAVDYPERVEALADLIVALQPWTGNDIPLRLVAFDQRYETLYEGPLGEIDRSVFTELRDRRALGASDIVGVLRHTAARRDRAVDRVILVSDGLATAGVEGRRALFKSVRELADAGVVRVDVLADVGDLGHPRLEGLVTQLPDSGLVLDRREASRVLVRRLRREVHDEVRVAVPGARWFHPEVVHGVQSDDEILVFADVETVGATLRVTVDAHGKETLDVPILDVEEPLVGWALENARIDFQVEALEREADASKATVQPYVAKQLWQKIVTNSRRNRVVNDYTRLVMLADEDDYGAVKMDVAGLPDVLVVGPSGVERRRRGVPNAIADDEVPLARTRLPRFARERLGAEQLRLYAITQIPNPGRDADAAMIAAAPLVGVGEGGSLPVELPTMAEEASADEGSEASEDGAGTAEAAAPPPERRDDPRRARPVSNRRRSGKARALPPARPLDGSYRGNMLAVMNLIAWGHAAEAEQVAWRWREAEPRSLMAVVALGEALEANHALDDAARAYGSIIDMYPDRADMRRFASARLERLGSAGARLAIDSYAQARRQRPDHPSSHRLLAFAQLRAGRPKDAFTVLADALRRDWSGDFEGIETVLREDLGVIAAVWIAAEPHLRRDITRRTEQLEAAVATEPSLRFALTWEKGGSDVDLHIRDGLGSHAFHERRALRSGGALDFDVRNGYGPEVFTILGKPSGYPYSLEVQYYNHGAGDVGLGKVQIFEHDGAGHIAFDERPFVVMKHKAFVDLGSLEGSLVGRH